MSSRKLLALDFIKRYFAQWGNSPTLGELAAALDVSTKRAHDLVHQLAQEQMIRRISGKTRGIELVDRGEELSEADVLVRLAKLGWTIGAGNQVVQPPGQVPGPAHALSDALLRTLSTRSGQAASTSSGQALMDKGLHSLPRLDHAPDDEDGSGGAGQAEGPSTGSGQAGIDEHGKAN